MAPDRTALPLPTAAMAALAAAAASAGACAPAAAEGLYLGARAAGAYMQPFETDFTDPVLGKGTLDLRHRLGFVAGGVVGYDFAPLRAEIEALYARTEIREAKARVAGVTATASGSDSYMNLAGGLANVYLDVPTGGALQPYVGAGIGWGWSRLGDRAGDNFVYQGAVGIDYAIGDGLTLGAGYRFIGFPVRDYNDGTPGRRFSSEQVGIHAVGIGMRLTFEPDTRQERARVAASTGAWPSPLPMADAQGVAQAGAQAGADEPPSTGAAAADRDAKAYAALRDARAAAAQSGQVRRDAPVAAPRAGSLPRNGRRAESDAPLQLPAPTRPVAPTAQRQAATADAATSPVSAFPAAVGGSGFGVQIGSFRERQHAVEAWPAKQREYGRLLQGLTPAVVETNVPGKGRWFRLYAAGMGRDAADRLCGAIKQRGDFCAIATL